MPRDKSENPIVRLLAVPFLVALGLLFGAAAVWPGLRKSIEGSIGEGNFIYLGVGFLFFYTAVLVAEKNLMRERFLGLMEEIMGFLSGDGKQGETDAVEIMIRALEKGSGQAASIAAAELKRLTGQDFGTSHAQWQAWWAGNRERFKHLKRDSFKSQGGTHDASE